MFSSVLASCHTPISTLEAGSEVLQFLTALNTTTNTFEDKLSPTYLNDALQSGEPNLMITSLDAISKQFEDLITKIKALPIPNIADLKELKNARIKSIELTIDMVEVWRSSVENGNYFTKFDDVIANVSQLSENTDLIKPLKLQQAILIKYDIPPEVVGFRTT